jgi:pentapeptide MXKDX repeat protein
MERIHENDEEFKMMNLKQAATLMFLAAGGALAATGAVHAQSATTKSDPMKTDAMKADPMKTDAMNADSMHAGTPKKRTIKAGTAKNDAMKTDVMAPKSH